MVAAGASRPGRHDLRQYQSLGKRLDLSLSLFSPATLRGFWQNAGRAWPGATIASPRCSVTRIRRTFPLCATRSSRAAKTCWHLLHKRLSTARTAALTQAQALYGLGGIGKTQTAAEYAFRYGDEYTHVFWIRAATRETLVADFVRWLNCSNSPEKDEQDQPRMVAAVKRWLAAHEGWLLILDNADDLPLAQEFLPTSHKGYILFTTRAQAAGAHRGQRRSGEIECAGGHPAAVAPEQTPGYGCPSRPGAGRGSCRC